MDADLLRAIAGHGVLGIVCAGLAWAYWKERAARDKAAKEFRDLQETHVQTTREMQREFLAKQEQLMAQHSQEMQLALERNIARTETMAQKHRELVSAQQNLLEAVAQSSRR